MKHWYHILAGLALAIVATSGLAQAYPSKAIRLIVPNAPAGLADISARLIAAKLTTALGQQVVVDNRVGAGSTIGTAMAVRAAPDGYTLLAVFDSHVTNPHLFKNIEYHTLTDLAPISLLVRGPLLLAVHPKLDAKTLQDLVKLAQARPGAINFATVGPGSPARLLMELLKLEARVDVTSVPYKGAGPAVNDLIAGQVDAMFATIPTLSPYVKTGRLHAIAITSEQRSAAVPRRLGYALERNQFGRKLIAFPRVSHKLTMMVVETMVARQLTYFAAREKDSGRRCDIEAGMAKLLAARVAWANADNALQIHGGNGYALEYPISRVLCDARILNIFEGAAEIQAQVIARRLLDGTN